MRAWCDGKRALTWFNLGAGFIVELQSPGLSLGLRKIL
jgi:hypothetical protein